MNEGPHYGIYPSKKCGNNLLHLDKCLPKAHVIRLRCQLSVLPGSVANFRT